ncbi:MAG: hypothetical protein Q9209_001672 [Squamulea sp. 1 TL-2023]
MAHPQPTTSPQTEPYNIHVYHDRIVHLERLIKQYDAFIQHPNLCGVNLSTEPCQQCIEQCLGFMADTFSNLLSTAPSPDLTIEYNDLQELSRLSKDFFRIEGNLGHWVYVLIDRKCKSLQGSRLAMEMCRRARKDDDWVTEERQDHEQDLQKIERMKRAVEGLASAIEVAPATTTAAANMPNSVALLSDVATLAVDVDEQGLAEEIDAPLIPSSGSVGVGEEFIEDTSPSDEDNNLSDVAPLEENQSNQEPERAAPLPTRTGLGLDFDVVEKEPGEVRVPAPPVPRLGRYRT